MKNRVLKEMTGLMILFSISTSWANVGDPVLYSTADNSVVELTGPSYPIDPITNGTKITNLAKGTASSDAVNVDQLNEVRGDANSALTTANTAQTTATAAQTTANTAQTTANTAQTTANTAQTTATAAQTTANTAQTTATAAQTTANAAQTTATAAETTANTAQTTANTINNQLNNGTIGLVQQIGGAPSNNPITVGASTGGTVITIEGTDGLRMISGLAAGLAGTDAVNLAQMQAAIASISPDGGGAVAINNSNNLAPAVASGKNSVAVGFGAQALGDTSTVVGNGAQASGVNSVAIGANSNDQGRNSVVSVGSLGNERQITNVAPGTQGTDAVNLDQLNSRLNHSQHTSNGGIAAAMAFAALPQVITPGKFLVAGGYGNYLGESGFSVGGSTALADGKILIKLGGTISSRGDGGGSLGFGLQF